MKKLKRRKDMLWLMVLALFFTSIASHLVYLGYKHHGKGAWEYGGDEPGTCGSIATDEFEEVIPEEEYKRNCYIYAGIFFLIGAVSLREFIKQWKERNELEKSWLRTISHPFTLNDLAMHPDCYREDFKKWVEENHPHLSIWKQPPHSPN